VRKAYNSWTAQWSALRSLGRAVAALRLREERIGFSTWSARVTHDGEEAETMRRAVASMMHGCVRSCLNTWMSYADARSGAEAVLSSALRSLMPEGRSMRLALNTWVGVWMQRSSMMVALAALTSSEQLWGLQVWWQHARLVRKHREHVEGTARRAIVCMTLQSVRAAMNSWTEMVEARSHAHQKLLSAASAFRGDGMRKAWNGWLSFASEQSAMASVIVSFRMRLQRAAFAAWASSRCGTAGACSCSSTRMLPCWSKRGTGSVMLYFSKSCTKSSCHLPS